MLKYIVKRLLWIIPVLIGVTIIVFTILYFSPGDPAYLALGDNATPEAVEAYRVEMGINGTYWERLGRTLGGLLKGDLGLSYRSRTPVLNELLVRFKVTFNISAWSIVLGIILGIFFGIISALKQNTLWDSLSTGCALFGISMPMFWQGLMLILVFSVWLGWLPASGYGSRYSLSIGFLAVGISVLTGGFLGVIAAYYPKLDNIIMRCMDLFMAIPQMLLAMCIVSALGSSLFNLMLAVGLSSTPKFARVVRASVLATREQEFVEAARAIGASNTRIILHHILPNSISALIVQATLAMAGAIISASALSFLGFGIQAPMPEWGAMLSAGRKYIRTQAYLTVIPGLAIMVVVYALNVVGDGLRDCLDPRLKK